MLRLFLLLALTSTLLAPTQPPVMIAQQPVAMAQQPAVAPIGTVPTRDALVTGGLEVRGEQARLLSNASVTAFDHTASVALARGGEVLVCSTSQFHILHSGAGPALLFGLDRGAVEIHAASQAQDVLLTPDIRFAVEAPGQFDLRVRVTREGDTCVDNAGETAPVLVLSDVFSSTSYRLLPRQHVLFEHGNLREVVDRERSSCGCPAVASVPAQVVAAKPGEPTSPVLAEAQHPFPAAASNDLAPPAPAPNSPVGEKSTQVATTFEYGEGKGPPPSTVDVPPGAATPSAAAQPSSPVSPNGTASSAPAQPPPSPPGAHDMAHAIGRFFHKLFHPRS